MTYRISLNNIWGWLFLLSHQKGERGWLFEGRRLFQLLLTGRRAQNIYIYIHIFLIPLNQAIITSNKLNMGFLSVPNWVPGLIFGAWIITHQFCWIRFHFNFTRRVQKKEKMTKGVGGRGGDYYPREATILNISIKGGRLFEGGD